MITTAHRFLRPGPHRLRIATALVSSVLASASFLMAPARAENLPGRIGDGEFWRIVTEFSEPDGGFQREYMSNEDSLQYVIPALRERMRRGGVYIGVGPEQNFTYVAALEPKIAFVVDIRRDNMLEHLMYKALFELSTDRTDFIGRLFSRKRPARLEADPTAQALFDAYQRVEPDVALMDDTVRAMMRHLTTDHGFRLSADDQAGISGFMETFRRAGPYALRGTGDRNATYAQLMAATDLEGRSQGYLASEEHFRRVQTLEKQNLIVPVVGDFAGDKALASIGRYLTDRDATVTVFYASNVERYLFEQGEHGRRFYSNVAALPRDPSSTFIRSATVDISRRLDIPIPAGDAKWRSFLSPIADDLKAFAEGRLQSYRDLFDRAR